MSCVLLDTPETQFPERVILESFQGANSYVSLKFNELELFYPVWKSRFLMPFASLFLYDVCNPWSTPLLP